MLTLRARIFLIFDESLPAENTYCIIVLKDYLFIRRMGGELLDLRLSGFGARYLIEVATTYYLPATQIFIFGLSFILRNKR